MTRPILCPGDEFATRDSAALGGLIRLVISAKSADNEATYNHTGIILDPQGTTLESLWTVKRQNIWEAYRGERVLIVRNANMSPGVFTAGYAKIEPHIGQWYPAHRLVLHFLGLAKFMHWSRVVCSELTAKFEAGCAEAIPHREAGFLRNWYGVNPDHLTDRWRISRFYQTVYEEIAG